MNQQQQQYQGPERRQMQVQFPGDERRKQPPAAGEPRIGADGTPGMQQQPRERRDDERRDQQGERHDQEP